MNTRGKVFPAIMSLTVILLFLQHGNSLSAMIVDTNPDAGFVFILDEVTAEKSASINAGQLLIEQRSIQVQNDDSLKSNLRKANELAKQGKIEEASGIFISLMENYPDNKAAVQGWLILNMKRSPTGEEEAIQTLADLAKKYPRNTGIIFFKMFLEAEHGHNEEALKDIETLIGLQPDSALNWVAKGQVLYELKQYPSSMDAFTRATNLDPKRADVWGMKAGAEAKSGKYAEALKSANKGIEIAPKSFVGIYNRACIYALMGEKTSAIADLKKAIELNPGIKNHARTDKDFESMFDDEEFKNTTK